MPQVSPGVEVTEQDFSFYVANLPTAIAAFQGICEKGPVATPTLITSWTSFKRIFGGLISTSYLAYAVKRALDRGRGAIYVNRVVHFTDESDPTTKTSVASTVVLQDSAPVDTLTINAVSDGLWGDDLKVTITNGTLDSTNEFCIDVYQTVSGSDVHREKWDNLSMVNADDNFVEKVINDMSPYIAVVDMDSVTAAPGDRPANQVLTALTGGDNGLTAIDDSDYIGDSAGKTGFFSFDACDDIGIVATPGNTAVAVTAAGYAYCEARMDCIYIASTPLGTTTIDAAVAYRKGTAPAHTSWNTTYMALYFPWLQIIDSLSGGKKYIPPDGDVYAAIAFTDYKNFPWFAPAGVQRGKVSNTVGLEYNAGVNKADRDALYSNTINPIVSMAGTGTVIYGQKTMALQTSAIDRINVRRLMIMIEKAIAAYSTFVVFEPNDAATWRALTRPIEAYMRDIKDRRGVYDFRIQCDEEINTPATIDRNELHCRIFVKPTKAAEFVSLDFVLTTTGAVFEEVFATATT